MSGTEEITIVPGPGGRDIIVSMDRSPHSWEAFTFAAKNIFRPQDAVTFFRVLLPDELKDTKFDKVNYRVEEMKTLHDTIKKFQADTGVDFKFRIHAVYDDDPKNAILDKIKTPKYAMIVLGSRGNSPLKSMLLGSTSSYLLEKSPIPVILSRASK